MPDRMIRDRCRQSPTLRELSDAGERGWWRLTVAVDDYGRFDADPEVLLAELFKRRPAGWTVTKMRRVVEEWEGELIHLYDVEGRPYGHVVHWSEYQRERDSKPRFPDPPCGGSPQLAAKCRESRQSAAPSDDPSSEGRSSEGRSSEGRGIVISAEGENHPWPSPEALVALYNAESADECPAVVKLTPARRAKAKKYLAAFPEESFWRQAFAESKKNRFLRGLNNRPGGGHEKFVADFDWYLSIGKNGAENCAKAFEGKYRG